MRIVQTRAAATPGKFVLLVRCSPIRKREFRSWELRINTASIRRLISPVPDAWIEGSYDGSRMWSRKAGEHSMDAMWAPLTGIVGILMSLSSGTRGVDQGRERLITTLLEWATEDAVRVSSLWQSRRKTSCSADTSTTRARSQTRSVQRGCYTATVRSETRPSAMCSDASSDCTICAMQETSHQCFHLDIRDRGPQRIIARGPCCAVW